MRGSFRKKLFVMMVLFAFSITIFISMIDYKRMKANTVESNRQLVNHIERTVQYTLNTLEKVYYYFDDKTAKQMKMFTEELLEKYEKSPDFSTWDYNALKEKSSMDIYIINKENTVIYSSFPSDIGLDFDKCCKKIAPIIQERRKLGGFYQDGIDLEQKTGKVRKYSYTATRDHQYVIQLGALLENEDVFRKFNFLETNDELVHQYPSIDDINILNIQGMPFGKPVDAWLTNQRKDAFDQVLSTGKTVEVKQQQDDREVVYRYIPYLSLYDKGTTRQKVIEIIYNDHLIQSILAQNKKKFLLQLFIILTITVIISFIITKWVARPMYLAFHDCLTGLKNRAAFEELMTTTLPKKGDKIALFMIDLDNFKVINDCLGHDAGDLLLKNVAKKIEKTIDKKGSVFRFGGDEFVVIFYTNKQDIVEEAANELISALQHSIDRTNELTKEKVSASIGIAIQPQHGEDMQTLYKKADIALYQSKNKGKAQYQIFEEAMLRTLSV